MYDEQSGVNYRASSLKAAELKACARENLLGKYAVIVLSVLLLGVIQSILSGAFSSTITVYSGTLQYIIYYFAMFIISVLYLFFEAGIDSMHLKASRNQVFQYSELLFAVRNSTNRFLTAGLILTAISFLWQIPFNLLMNYGIDYALNWATAMDIMDFGTVGVPAADVMLIIAVVTLIGAVVSIVLSLSFALVMFFLIDNPQMTAKEAFAQSWRCMKGQRMRLLCLYLSFIGLYLLSILTFGIGILWVAPYLKQSVTVFYEDVTDKL